jgi:hypothetical protein
MNDFDKQRRAANIERAIERTGKLQKLMDWLDEVRVCDLAHARTERTVDLLDLLMAQHEASRLIDDVLGCDLSSFREDLEYEALRECRFDIKGCTFVDENGESVED